MILLQHHYNRYHPGKESGPDQVELLQTDVMRFMAILGLCLMVIFALVNAIPLERTDRRPQLVKSGEVAQVETKIIQPVPAIKTIAKWKSEPREKQPVPLSSPVSTDRPQTEGFALRFASEAVLQSLIKRKQVTLFAMIGRRAWQLDLKNAHITYGLSDQPSTFYKMYAPTVPLSFKNALKTTVAVFGRKTVTWGVTLPESTRGQIAKAMVEKRGGELVILSNGNVTLNQGGK